MIHDPEGRRNWIKVVNRSGSCSQKHWQPNKNHCVCHKHFVEIPTKKRKPGNLDCTEVPIEGPRYFGLQAHTWLDYKKHNRLKFLVAIAPNGPLTFVSVPYSGRASDRHIVQDSGFLDKISPTDQVMADRGFPFQSDLVVRQASLIIPPPGQGTEQMTKENVLKTK